MNQLRPFIYAAFLTLAFSWVGRADQASDGARRARALMGTVMEISVHGGPDAQGSTAVTAAFDEVARLENIFSLYRSDSELSRLNRAPAHQATTVSNDLIELADYAAELSRRTEGAFDSSVEPLAKFWRAGGQWTRDAWRSSAESVGQNHFHINREKRTITRLHQSAGLNFDGIAKGYALDRAADALLKAGTKSATLNFGGQILTFGDHGTHTISVADPVSGSPVATFDSGGGSVSTSSQHERTVKNGGREWGHVLDPRTRRVVERTGSVTALAPTAAEADALSTALLVLGRVDGTRMLDREFPEAGAVFLEGKPGAWRISTAGRFPAETLQLLSRDVRVAHITKKPGGVEK